VSAVSHFQLLKLEVAKAQNRKDQVETANSDSQVSMSLYFFLSFSVIWTVVESESGQFPGPGETLEALLLEDILACS
jgi:hypothetical protein